METKRLFIGLVIDATTTSAIVEEFDYLDKNIWQPTKPENLHITALFLGDVVLSTINDIVTIVGNIASRTRPFTLTGGRTRIMQPDEPTMLWLRFERNSWFERLATTLEGSFHKIGTWEKQRDRKHRRPTGGDKYPIPHITLARVRDGELLDSLLPPFEASAGMENFVARSLALFSSSHDKKSGITYYEKIAEWSLVD